MQVGNPEDLSILYEIWCKHMNVASKKFADEVDSRGLDFNIVDAFYTLCCVVVGLGMAEDIDPETIKLVMETACEINPDPVILQDRTGAVN